MRIWCHLGQADYKEQQKLLRKELEKLGREKVSGAEWRQQNINLLRDHTYFTSHARSLWADGQAENFRQQLDKQAEKGSNPNQMSLPITRCPRARHWPP